MGRLRKAKGSGEEGVNVLSRKRSITDSRAVDAK